LNSVTLRGRNDPQRLHVVVFLLSRVLAGHGSGQVRLGSVPASAVIENIETQLEQAHISAVLASLEAQDFVAFSAAAL